MKLHELQAILRSLSGESEVTVGVDLVDSVTVHTNPPCVRFNVAQAETTTPDDDIANRLMLLEMAFHEMSNERIAGKKGVKELLDTVIEYVAICATNSNVDAIVAHQSKRIDELEQAEENRQDDLQERLKEAGTNAAERLMGVLSEAYTAEEMFKAARQVDDAVGTEWRNGEHAEEV